jgi:hypothetical protein
MIRGIKPNKLSSRPIHIENHVWADRVKRIPDKRAVINNRFAGLVVRENESWCLFIEIGKWSSFLALGLEHLALDIFYLFYYSWIRGFSLAIFHFIHVRFLAEG